MITSDQKVPPSAPSKRKPKHDPTRLETTSTASRLPPGGVSGDGGDILNPTDLHAGTSEGTERRLGSGPRSLRFVAASRPDLDVKGGDTEGLALLGNILGGKHRSVGGSLVTVSFDLHSTGDTNQGFAPGKIGNMHEGIVKGGEKVSDGKHLLSLSDLGAEGGGLFNRLLVRHCL